MNSKNSKNSKKPLESNFKKMLEDLNFFESEFR